MEKTTPEFRTISLRLPAADHAAMTAHAKSERLPLTTYLLRQGLAGLPKPAAPKLTARQQEKMEYEAKRPFRAALVYAGFTVPSLDARTRDSEYALYQTSSVANRWYVSNGGAPYQHGDPLPTPASAEPDDTAQRPGESDVEYERRQFERLAKDWKE